MTDITILKREYYASALGLSDAEAAIMSISDLEYLFFGNPPILNGAGSPVGVVSAEPGVIWQDLEGTNGVWAWKKKTGSGNTGWVVLDGDTGWRNIASSLINGATGDSSRSFVRRQNNMVYWYLTVTFPAWASGTTFLLAPAGFRPFPALYDYYLPTASYGGGTESYILTSTGELKRYATAATTIRMTWSYPVDEAWPTSLPGIAL